MPACTLSPSDRQRQVRLVGNDLLKTHGRRPYCTVEDVRDAHRRQGFAIDVACRSHATFHSRAEYHEARLHDPVRA